MRLGFTGTRRGMTAAQRAACAELLASLAPEVVHHGDAVGADAEMHGLALAAGLPVVVHPPLNPSHRAFCQGGEVLEPRSHKRRDRDVVDATDLLLGTPAAPEDEGPHSGTGTRSGTRRGVGVRSSSCGRMDARIGEDWRRRARESTSCAGDFGVSGENGYVPRRVSPTSAAAANAGFRRAGAARSKA